ncbi:hypothetical protein [uncultured Psychroserpens sp.]|uniref:hypothetical protein n=1 Tax=uncultured Psychroserpens sp. TaxID=255436 RepID=UPI00263925A9|nr:hypothetical protein [uncultured Psychroserpens sp.]
MNLNTIKNIGLLFLMLLLASCNKYARKNYPQFVSKPESYKHINSCYSADIQNLDDIPIDVKNNVISYLKNRLGNDNFQKLEFDHANVLSNRLTDIETIKTKDNISALLGEEDKRSDCDTISAFPIYSVVYQLKNPEIGIEKIGLNVMIDNNGKTIKDIEFPRAEFVDIIIPIDSVHSELIRRKIPSKNLTIELWFDKKTESLFWSTNTVVRKGSIAGPSCFPEIDYHFKMNAITGKITTYTFETHEDYFAERY